MPCHYFTNCVCLFSLYVFKAQAGAYRGIEEGGARIEKCCDNRNEARRAEFAQGWGPGEGMCPFPGEF